MERSFPIRVNGRTHTVEGVPANTPLLEWLRSRGLTGSKQGCAEGDCGACTVALVDTGSDGKPSYRAINSCIAPLPSFAGRELLTVEGVADPRDGSLHPVQRAMVAEYGSQCGYCTPGFTVSMLEAFYRPELERPWQIADQLCGNLCRCTGYRPIRDAMTRALGERCQPKADDRLARALEAPAKALVEVAYEGAAQRFLRPTTIAGIFDALALHPDARLVAGATEIGVEINKKHLRFPCLVSTEGVAELRSVVTHPSHFLIGGAATLTAIEEAMAGELPGLGKMLRVFASRQIRNRATLAGNLVTASPIGDLPPVMLALDAEVVLLRREGGVLVERVVPIAEFFVGYRKTAMVPGELLSAVRVPRGPSAPGLRRSFETFKVSKRRELDISIVAAAFTLDRDEAGVVRHARLAYGGVAATPVRARRVEALLIGKMFTPATVAAVLPVLAEAFEPIDDVRAGASYRRGLIASLLEKFASGETSEAQDELLGFTTSAGAPATQKPSISPHRELPHESGVGHTTGGALYVDDQAWQRGGVLELWPVMAPHAHARILRRDATRARAMPGVRAVLLAEDIPGENDIGAIRKDEVLLARDEVSFHGQMVAVVVADTVEEARLASLAVEVEYEALPALLSIDAAIAADSFHTQPHRIRRGDCAAAMARSPHRVAGELRIGGQEHFYLETQAAYAEPGDDGDVLVLSSTQHPSEIQAVVSHVLHLPRNKVVVESPRMGGGFGGKETQGNGFAALCALAAVVTRRPARLQLDRDLDMTLTGKRHPFLARFEAGFDARGKLLALSAQLVSDGGWALDLSESICDRALFHIDNAYYIPAVDVSGRVAKTHCVSHTAFRGFGGPQGMLVIEEVMDRVARRLGVLPELVREANLYGDAGEAATTHYGQPIVDNRIGKIWRSLSASARLDERRQEIAAWNSQSPRIKRGIAQTPVKFGISFTASFLNQAGALVVIYRDGSVQVNHGGTEMGQGLYTKMRGVAMRELGLPAERVRVMKTRTDKVPNTSATAASSGADLNGAAVKDACDTLRERLRGVAARMLSVPGAALVFSDGKVGVAGGPQADFAAVCERAYLEQVQLSAAGFYRTPGLAYDKSKGHGRPFHYFAFGAAVTEVELDGYSGMKRIRRVDILHDVGDSLNPGIDRGQIEGAFVQGAGWLTSEELAWDARGRLLTHSASTYQIPAISDAPAELHVTLLPHAAQADVVHGSKAVGEPPFMLAISVREALRDAVAAFGTAPDGPDGEIPLAVPATHEALFAAVKSVTRGARET